MVERFSQEQLRHVQNNRDKRVARRAPVPIGKLAEELIKEDRLAGPAWRRRLLAVLTEHAKPLLEHASVVGIRGGVLRLHVTEPALMYSLRMAWEQRLLNVLRTELPESGIQALRFTTGASPETSA